MKNIKSVKRSRLFVFTVFIVACLVPSAYSDSFVDDRAMDALKDFRLGYSASTAPQTDDALTQTAYIGDSFIDASVIEATKDFRFGYSAPAEKEYSPVLAETSTFKGDSFVDAEAAKQLEDFTYPEWVRRTHEDGLAAIRGLIIRK